MATLAIIFGGKSCERNVSVATGIQVVNLAKKHKVVPIYVDGNGVWRTDKAYDTVSGVKTVKGKKVHLRPASNYLFAESGKKLCAIDCAVICCHGLNGEDGTLQGLLQLSGIPYTGSGVAASAVGMDKVLMKRVFRDAGLPQVEFTPLRLCDYNSDFYGCVDKFKDAEFPLIVKPANLGSSIGITMAHDADELIKGIRTAFEWDNEVVVEEALTDFTEINCAVFGRGNELIASELEQPVGWSEFLTYKDKYSNGLKEGRKMPAPISDELTAQIKELALKAFSAVGASGIARIDFMVKGETAYVNEINTIPGSLAAYLFAFGDRIKPERLIDELVELAKAEQRARDRLKYSYDAEPKAKR